MDADVIVIGAGISGMATAARLEARGVSTLVLEAHGQPGGCAGAFRRRGFSFDVGATTLVDFEPGGVGGRFLAEIGLADLPGETLPGYRAWLPDRTVDLHRDLPSWRRERLAAFGDTPAHRRFWRRLDRLAEVFWQASRGGLALPTGSPRALAAAARALPLRGWPLARHLDRTMAWALSRAGLGDDVALGALLAMLLQDTVHAGLAEAPLVNAALGVTIRGAGLTRAHGGMGGFFRRLAARYRELGGRLVLAAPVERLERLERAGSERGDPAGFRVTTPRRAYTARQVVSTLPIWNGARLGPPEVAAALAPYLARDGGSLGGAAVLFLGVPESEVGGQALTHHQVLLDYRLPLGDGNNMFVSVSSAGDLESAPPGCRAAMLSTHTELASWEGLSREDYAARKAALAARLLAGARRPYPELGRAALVREMATPRTFARFTSRHRGAVGGIRLHPGNANFHAVPHDLGVPGYWQAGDTTWPGLGTVACILGSLHVADGVERAARRRGRSRRPSKALATRTPAAAAVSSAAALPSVAELGEDLLATTARRRWVAVARPFGCAALYALFAALGWWWAAVGAVAVLFVAIVASAHDLVHRSLGLPRRTNEVLLALVGMLVLESGHAYKASHLQHHARFPLDDDPEGDPARMGFLRALLEGPVFLFRLWIWAWRRAPAERRWLALEAAWFAAFWAAGIALWPQTHAVLLYAVLVVAGSWVYPVATVHLPHDVHGDGALFQTHTLRGRLVPALFLELTYHLEHHLYPAVPSHHYAELATRLEPHLAAHGVEPVRVW